LNAVSSHGTCTAVFVLVSAIASFCLASIRTLGKIKWAAWVGVGSIFTAGGLACLTVSFRMPTETPLVMIATIAVGLQERPPTAPRDSQWASDYKIVGSPSFMKAVTAVSSIVFAYAGTPGQFNYF
jgi:hypothetical protein